MPTLLRRERRALVEFLEYLAEYDRRRLYERSGYAAALDALTEKLEH